MSLRLRYAPIIPPARKMAETWDVLGTEATMLQFDIKVGCFEKDRDAEVKHWSC